MMGEVCVYTDVDAYDYCLYNSMYDAHNQGTRVSWLVYSHSINRSPTDSTVYVSSVIYNRVMYMYMTLTYSVMYIFVN